MLVVSSTRRNFTPPCFFVVIVWLFRFVFLPIAEQAKGGDDSDEDSLFDDDDSDASSDDDEDGRGELKGRARWLKKVVTAKSQEEEGNVQHILSFTQMP